MPVSLLLCDLRVERAPFPHETDTAVVLSRLGLLLRHARQVGWGVAHMTLRRSPPVGGPIPGFEPLRSEAVYSTCEDAPVDPSPVLASDTDCPLALAGFGYRDIIAPILAYCVREHHPAILLVDATAWGPERAFAQRRLAQEGVRIETVKSLIGGPSLAH